jgi:AcrR family transcriptional regulator
MHTMRTDGLKARRTGLRREQVALTEQRVVEAATALFVDRGYVATSLLDVAAAAGVSPRTVYVRFHSKARLLERCIETSIAGDVRTAGLLDGEEARLSLESPTLHERIDAIVATTRAIMERSASLLAVGAQAAAVEPEIAAMERVAMQRTLGDLRAIAERLATDGLLPPGVTAAVVTDLLWVLAGPRTMVSLTTDRGWTPARYATWLDATLRAFLHPRGRPPASRHAGR